MPRWCMETQLEGLSLLFFVDVLIYDIVKVSGACVGPGAFHNGNVACSYDEKGNKSDLIHRKAI